MFVLLFGLMGVAAIFPVGNHFVVEGEKFDLGSAMAQNAFEELKARGMLRPEVWLYGRMPPNDGTITGDTRFIDPSTGSFNRPLVTGTVDGPGHVFVIDPLGNANQNEIRFPYYAREIQAGSNTPGSTITGWTNIWNRSGGFPPLGISNVTIAGELWPIRRITLPVPDPSGAFSFLPMSEEVAETIFRLRDDLAVEQPEEPDQPSNQLWDTNANGTIDDPTNDFLLRRQYKGDYSWIATIAPNSAQAIEALQPSHEAYGEVDYAVSVVVFRKRDTFPSEESERLVFGELHVGGDLVVFDPTNSKETLDELFKGIRPGNWIALSGVDQTTGGFILKWYRILSLDDESLENQRVANPLVTNQVATRRLMLAGPDWPATATQQADGYVGGLGAVLLPDVVTVVTKPLKMENTSLWSLE